MLKQRLELPWPGSRRCQRLVPPELLVMLPDDFGRSACMYRAVTRQIEVTVEPNFLPERSSAENRQYFWSYTIVITNTGAETVQLRTRHWIITDASGRKQEVRAEGVVGAQPVFGLPGARPGRPGFCPSPASPVPPYSHARSL